jgi:CRP/FNR family cyclic AMP-dependent transcriptional regulator
MASPPPDLAAFHATLPRHRVAAGETLIEEGVRTDRLYVLEEGGLEIVRGGIRVVEVREPGAFVGEISALLGTPPTASVIAVEDSVLLVVDHASAAVAGNAALTHAVARLLARRLQAVTSYLVDLKRQYADTDTHLALMDQVLADLMAAQARTLERPGSERGDVPPY